MNVCLSIFNLCVRACTCASYSPDLVQAPSRLTMLRCGPRWVMIFSSDIRACFSLERAVAERVVKQPWLSNIITHFACACVEHQKSHLPSVCQCGTIKAHQMCHDQFCPAKDWQIGRRPLLHYLNVKKAWKCSNGLFFFSIVIQMYCDNSRLSIFTATFMTGWERLSPYAVPSTTFPKAPEPRIRPLGVEKNMKSMTNSEKTHKHSDTSMQFGCVCFLICDSFKGWKSPPSVSQHKPLPANPLCSGQISLELPDFKDWVKTSGPEHPCREACRVTGTSKNDSQLTEHKSVSGELPSGVVGKLHGIHIDVFMAVRAHRLNDPPTNLIPWFLKDKKHKNKSLLCQVGPGGAQWTCYLVS